jgi:hypothetical protein
MTKKNELSNIKKSNSTFSFKIKMHCSMIRREGVRTSNNCTPKVKIERQKSDLISSSKVIFDELTFSLELNINIMIKCFFHLFPNGKTQSLKV